ncbi:MAG: adenylate kinase [Ignavibacteria bacterium]|nr:adenylate kinase [Ignavibacteria bacterium]
MRLIFLGPPGAGKGTQSELICKDFGIKQISTGDLLRYHRIEGTELGKKAQFYMDKGELVPDEIIIEMIRNELRKTEYLDGFLLDGFPRTIPQAEALDKLLSDSGLKLDAVLVLIVPMEELVARLTARRVCPKCGKVYHLISNPPKNDNICDIDGIELYQRTDDTEETVRNRLNVYEQQTAPLIGYYENQGLAYKVDGNGKIEDIYKKIKDIILKILKGKEETHSEK